MCEDVKNDSTFRLPPTIDVLFTASLRLVNYGSAWQYILIVLTDFQLGLSSLRNVAAQALIQYLHCTRRDVDREKKACFVISTRTTSNLGSCQGRRHMHVCMRCLEAIYSFGLLPRPWLFFLGLLGRGIPAAHFQLRLSSSRCLFPHICS